MSKFKLLLSLLVLGAASVARAELKPGASLAPYEIYNTTTGKAYCQMCAYSAKPATVAAYGKLGDAQFWADLEKLQAMQNNFPGVGFFAQVLDSTNAVAIQAEAKKHGITFPVVYAKDADWDEVYQVKGISRTIYYSKEFKVTLSKIGLDDKALVAVEDQLKKDAKG